MTDRNQPPPPPPNRTIGEPPSALLNFIGISAIILLALLVALHAFASAGLIGRAGSETHADCAGTGGGHSHAVTRN